MVAGMNCAFCVWRRCEYVEAAGWDEMSLPRSSVQVACATEKIYCVVEGGVHGLDVVMVDRPPTCRSLEQSGWYDARETLQHQFAGVDNMRYLRRNAASELDAP